MQLPSLFLLVTYASVLTNGFALLPLIPSSRSSSRVSLRSSSSSSSRSGNEDLTNKVVAAFESVTDDMQRGDEEALTILQGVSQDFRRLASVASSDKTGAVNPPPQQVTPPPPPPVPRVAAVPPTPPPLPLPLPAPATIIPSPMTPPIPTTTTTSTEGPFIVPVTTSAQVTTGTQLVPLPIPQQEKPKRRWLVLQPDHAVRNPQAMVQVARAFASREIATPNPPNVQERLHPTINYFSDGMYRDAHGTGNRYRQDQGSPASFTMVNEEPY